MKKRRLPRAPGKLRRDTLAALALASGVAQLSGNGLGRQALADLSESPEQETLRLARMLHPIPDDRWREIAGTRINEQYDVVQGDNLWSISGRLFGDPRYWPKIWAMNNDSILNPHLIHPGVKIAFLPGTGTSLPGVRIDGPGGSAAPESSAKDSTPLTMETLEANQGTHHKRPDEWKYLPPQSWEYLNVINGPVLTEMKLENHLQKDSQPVLTIELPALVSANPLDDEGEIEAAPSRHELFQDGDHVLIDGAQGTTAGQIYSVSQEPTQLKGASGKVEGYAYRLLGRIKVLSRQDEYWDGVVISAQDGIQRGSFLLPEQPRIHPNATPVAGPATLYGQFMLDHVNVTYLTAQHGFGFVDLGASDGVSLGMVFQSYQYNDPTEDKRVISNDVFPLTNLQVIQVSDHFCTVMVISGRSEITEGTPVKLLTDVSVLKENGQVISVTDAPDVSNELPPPEVDDSGLPPASDSGDGGATPPAAAAADQSGTPPPPPGAADQNGTPPPPPPAASTPAADSGQPAANDLNKMNGPDLQPGEKGELKQLENYKGASGDTSGQQPPTASASDLPPPPPAAGDGSAQPPPPTAPADAPPPPQPPAQQQSYAPPPEEDAQPPKGGGNSGTAPGSATHDSPPDTAPDSVAPPPPPPVTGNENIPFPPDSEN